MISNNDDTIAAIATGLSDSGIGIIRISGRNAIEISDKIFIPANPSNRLISLEGYRAAYGRIVYEGRTYDEAVALVMRAPKTYTREDVVELDCHGGVTVLKSVLELLLNMGVRQAEPGEFTKRAFLNGRLDLAQAESVMELIHAKNERSMNISLKQLSGTLSKTIKVLRETILTRTAYIESALDDPENYSLDNFSTELLNDVDNMLKTVDKLIASANDGHYIKEGINTVIVGRPNAGKSSVMNMLLNEDRAIVTDIAGTTRDTINECINLGGITLNIADTAGIRESSDTVEKIGIERAKNTLSEADLVLFTVDGSEELTPDDEEIMELIKDKKSITLINKNDREIIVDKLLITSKINTEILEISALNGNGREELASLIKSMFFSGDLNTDSDTVITSLRHKALLIETRDALSRVKDSINAGMEEDFFTIDLMAAYQSLGLILGEELEDDLADKIFAEFCMGK